MSRGFSIAHSQVTPGLDNQSRKLSQDSLGMQQKGDAQTGEDPMALTPNNDSENINVAFQDGTMSKRKGYQNFYCDQEDEDLDKIRRRTELKTEGPREPQIHKHDQSKKALNKTEHASPRSSSPTHSPEEKDHSCAASPGSKANPTGIDQKELISNLQKGSEILANRNRKSFFEGLTDNLDQESSNFQRRRLDIQNVVEAANDCLLAGGSSQVLLNNQMQQKKPYNIDELQIGKNTVEEMLQNDLAEGLVNKYTLKIISDPKSVPQWEQSRFDNMKRADDAMKTLRKQIAQARLEGKIPPRSVMKDSNSKLKQLDSSIFMKKIGDDEEMSDSELEEIEEQLTGQTTIRQLAEFKARGIGDEETANKVRNNELSAKQMLEYIEDESVFMQQKDPSRKLTHSDATIDGEISPSTTKLAPKHKYEQANMVASSQPTLIGSGAVLDSEVSKGSRPDESIAGSGVRKTMSVVQGAGDLKKKSQDGKHKADTAIPKNISKITLKDKRLQDELGLSEGIVESPSDVDLLVKIQERAQQTSPIGLFSNKLQSGSESPKKRRASTNSIKGMGKDEDDKDGHNEHKAIEDAVLKIVTNLDQSIASAEAMKLTKNHMLDILRKVTQEKFKALELVRKHFAKKVEKVIAAKDYQIRCQRMICMDASKKIISETTKDSTKLFNVETVKLTTQYNRILDLVEYFERVVKEQGSVISLQEQIIGKLSLRINAINIDVNSQTELIDQMKTQSEYTDTDIQAMFNKIPKQFYEHEPFNFYSGNFYASPHDKQLMLRDQIYQRQECELYQKNLSIEALEQQVNELTWLNSQNEAKYARVVDKYEEKKQKMKSERTKLLNDMSFIRQTYEKYIDRLKKVMTRDYDKFQQQLEYVDLQLEVANANTGILRGRIDKYLEVAKQAKSVLRVPRLCSLYHNKVKELTETEASQLLEKLYNEWYGTTKEQRNQNLNGPLKPNHQKPPRANTTDKEPATVDGRPISKIEESLIDRSTKKIQVGRNSNMTQNSQRRSNNVLSPMSNQATLKAQNLKHNKNEIFYRSLDGNTQWQRQATRDSSHFGVTIANSSVVGGNAKFTACPPSTAGYGIGSINTYASKTSGDRVTQKCIGRIYSPETMFRPNEGRKFVHNAVTVQQSVDVAGIGMRSIRNSSDSRFLHGSLNWRKQTLMQKAQNTLSEIHEMARKGTRGTAINVPKASPDSVNQESSDINVANETLVAKRKIQVQVMSNASNRIETVQGSRKAAENIQHDETLRLAADKTFGSFNNGRPSQIEDSMMSANSSVDNDTFLNSLPTFEQSTIPQPPRTSGKMINRGRRGQSLAVRSRDQQKFMSSSVQVNSDRCGNAIQQAVKAAKDNIIQKEDMHIEDGSPLIKDTRNSLVQDIRCPPINITALSKRQNVPLMHKTSRKQSNTQQQDFINKKTMQSIELREKKRMRAHIPAYQIFTSIEGQKMQSKLAHKYNNSFDTSGQTDLSHPSIFKPTLQKSSGLDLAVDLDQTLFTSRQRATACGIKEPSLFQTTEGNDRNKTLSAQKTSQDLFNSQMKSIER